MPFPWVAAFKVIPWSDVIAAAPTVARSAQKLWKQVGRGKGETPASIPARSGEPLDDRLARLERELTRLAEQSSRQAELISTLAEQSERLVEAVEVLRLRSRVLGGVSLLLAIGLVLALALR